MADLPARHQPAVAAAVTLRAPSVVAMTPTPRPQSAAALVALWAVVTLGLIMTGCTGGGTDGSAALAPTTTKAALTTTTTVAAAPPATDATRLRECMAFAVADAEMMREIDGLTGEAADAADVGRTATVRSLYRQITAIADVEAATWAALTGGCEDLRSSMPEFAANWRET
ncbi:hypothetical protein [Candidatus Poriferisodalis sp.]|uniref:hypothetical protein n=1 Tax=Candidatus Poriferisodalis sp. TaxID=3101277 RepID=UPI003AF4E545